jgi:hypothetical protein
MKAAPSVGTEDQLFEWRKQSVDPDEKKKGKSKAKVKWRGFSCKLHDNLLIGLCGFGQILHAHEKARN